MKFATKIFIYIFLSTALIIGGMSIASDIWISNHHIRTLIRFEKELAMLVALKSEDYILRNDRVELYRFFQSIIKVNPYIEYVFVQRENEILVHTFDKGVPKGLLTLHTIDTPYNVDIIPIEDNLKNLIYHLRVSIRTPPATQLHFGVSDRKIRTELNALRHLMIYVGSILLISLPLGLALFISRMVSRPLSALGDAVKRIGGGELNVRVQMQTGDEIGHLVNDVNIMAEKLEKLRNGLEAEIKEHKRTEQRLAVQTELLNNILNHLPHNIFWKDTQFNYLGCNKAFAKESGLEIPEMVVGKNDYDLPWKKNEADFFKSNDKKVIDTECSLLDLEKTLTKVGEREKTILISEVPLKDLNGKVFGLLGIFYDITERKQMEETIKHAQKMEAIGTLAGGIAHDFNNILGSIIGYTELAIDDIDKDSETGSFLEQIFSSALRAKDLVRQILTFSRKSREERSPIQLSIIVKEGAKLLRSTLPTTIEICRDIDESTGMVNADPTQMHQIIMNLCTNAAHAMAEKGGILKLELSSVMITEDHIKRYHDIRPGFFVKLKISDSGAGIDSRIIHRIFDPFFTTKEKGKGTGMGLAIVHGIVKNHGGDIIVQSRLGKGSTFTILLPEVTRKDRGEQKPYLDLPCGNEQILLVDDEKSLLNLGQKILTSLGYNVVVKNDSLDALETFRQSPDFFDIIISDQTMPHMTGYHLATKILEINPTIPFILCTGYSDTITSEKVEAAGIKSLLYKPIIKRELAEAIRKALA